jgi:hypothetical protein
MDEERQPVHELSVQASSMPRSGPRRLGPGSNGLAAVAVALVAIFLVTLVIRAPWRGHLAAGDQWVTALAVRWARAWYREGALKNAFALVDSPLTSEFALPVRKWGLPGHVLLLHAIFTTLGLEPTVERVMWVNLGLHLVIALQLAAVAYLLARWTEPDRPHRAAVVALHCGAFTLLLPVMLYWGQNLSVQDFTAIPLMITVVVGRWVRADVGSRWGRVAIDLVVATCVVLGVVTEFLFWLLVPYLIVARLRAARGGRARTTDPWVWTLAVPYVLTMVVLLLLFIVQGYFEFMASRAAAWVIVGGDSNPSGGSLMAARIFFVGKFVRDYFSDAFQVPGFVALGVAVWWLLPRGRLPALPARARGVLVDLLLPCVLVTIAMASNQANHTHAAMKYVPYIALAWTFLTPLVIGEASPRRRSLLRATFAVVAVLAIVPFSSGYAAFFPAPDLRWEREAAFLHARSVDADLVVSPTADIDMNPPQRATLADRVVHQAYGPLDVLERVTWMPADAMIALYGARESSAAFGAGTADVVDDGEFCLVRFPVGQLRAFMQARPDAVFRAHLGEVLAGALSVVPVALRPFHGVVRAPPLPVAMHTTDTKYFSVAGYDRLYWSSERRFHWKEFQQRRRVAANMMVAVHARETLVLGDRRYVREWSLWEPVDATSDVPVEWGRFVLGLYDQVRDGSTRTFDWWGYQFVLVPVETIPELLRERAPDVSAWNAMLVSTNGTPVAVVLGPSKPAGSPYWMAVLFDDIPVPIARPEEVFHPWTIRNDGR